MFALFQIAGALAEEGRNLTDIVQIVSRAVDSMGTVSLQFTAS